MNYSTAVMLINPNIRAIKTIYSPDNEKTGTKGHRYVFKTLDPEIRVGDLVVVPTETRHGMTVVKVEEVDVEIDFEASTQIKWIVSRVKVADYESILTKEGEWIEALKASEKRRKREEIKKNMLAMYEDDGIDKLSIATLQGPPTIEHRPVTPPVRPVV